MTDHSFIYGVFLCRIHSLLTAVCDIVQAAPYDAGRLFGAFFVKVGDEAMPDFRLNPWI
jgi:hypothetical protein